MKKALFIWGALWFLAVVIAIMILAAKMGDLATVIDHHDKQLHDMLYFDSLTAMKPGTGDTTTFIIKKH
jgi:hypothetical protein